MMMINDDDGLPSLEPVRMPVDAALFAFALKILAKISFG